MTIPFGLHNPMVVSRMAFRCSCQRLHVADLTPSFCMTGIDRDRVAHGSMRFDVHCKTSSALAELPAAVCDTGDYRESSAAQGQYDM